MATPTTREQHKQYCLRSLGSPVIDINVDDEQLEDRIDESLQYFRDYHYDGTEHVYLKHQITSSDKTNEYMTNIVTQVVLELNRTILFQVKLPHPSICVVTYPKELH